MALSLTGKKKIVNLVFKDHVIRHTEMKTIDPPVVQTYGEYFLPPGIIRDGKIVEREDLVNILEQYIDEWNLAKKDVRFLVPDPFIIIRKIMIPKEVNDDEIEGYLYLELGVSIHLPFEDPVFDAVVVGETETEKQLLLFAAPESTVNEYSSVLEECRLKPTAADISPLALYRLYYEAGQADPNDHLLLLQLDLLTVNTSIFVDHRPIFIRNIAMPEEEESWEREFLSSTQEYKLHYTGDKEAYLKELEDTYTEIGRVLSFYKYSLNSGGDAVTKIIVSGDHPFMKEIVEEIRMRADAPVDYLDGSSLTGPGGETLAERFYLAGGLALKGVR